ncbi:DNA-binding transcriptional MocR family regulator [Nocardiopsis sp. Huas11]|uniref:aminotransferase-like domain-containing protein n=1 Tax=Nocardiopsis sp. Huas11 TaxID=2183912 RepID=UPI000EB22391|nr:PLP-dependent aminotransferase family protein [Nocardiopsis sp. Huas11]RKS05648.1 DNA-binding transcriptional MocR family regulator [Nocardiopsis sp. Huas11]
MSEPISPGELTALLGRWAAGRGPLYRLLAARLRGLIDEEALAPGAGLPAERRLAAHLSVGRGTVVAAYDLLSDERRLVRRRGSGTRVAPGPDPVPAPVRRTHDGSLFLSMFEPVPGTLMLTCAAPDAPPPELHSAYREAAVRLDVLANDIGYHPTGLIELRTVIAERFTERGLPTAPDEVLVTNGAQQALDLLVRCHVSAGDTVLVERPTYPGALALFGEAAAHVRAVDTGAEGVDVPALLAAMAEAPALTYLVPSFHNPTGSVLSPLLRRRIAAAAGEHGGLVVDDETMVHLGFDGRAPAPLASFPGGEDVVTVGSLSKLVWGGLRIGWIRARRPVLDRLRRTKILTDLGGDVLSQLAAAHLLRDPAPIVRRRGAELRRQHDRLGAELRRRLPDWEFAPAAGGQTLWVRLPHGDSASFAQVALRHGVALLPGDSLCAGGGGSSWLRLPFLASTETLTEAVERITRAWEHYGETDAPPAPPLGALAV